MKRLSPEQIEVSSAAVLTIVKARASAALKGGGGLQEAREAVYAFAAKHLADLAEAGVDVELIEKDAAEFMEKFIAEAKNRPTEGVCVRWRRPAPPGPRTPAPLREGKGNDEGP